MPNSITININMFYAIQTNEKKLSIHTKHCKNDKTTKKNRTNDNNSLIAERTQWQTRCMNGA